jgi:GTP-binding protein HflX
LSLSIPYDRGDVVAAAHRLGEVVEEKHDAAGTILDVRVPKRATGRFDEFVIA